MPRPVNRRSVIDSSWYRRPDGVPERQAAGGVVARLEAGRILVAAVREGPSGECALPKGKLEKGEDAEAAARREIEEEAGLSDLVLLADLGVRERLDFRKTHWKKTRYFLYATRQVEGTPTDPKHSEAVAWLPLDSRPPLFWPEQEALLRENEDFIRRLLDEHRTQ